MNTFDGIPLTQAEIQRAMELRGWRVTRSRIHQMERNALARLSSIPELRKLATELELPMRREAATEAVETSDDRREQLIIKLLADGLLAPSHPIGHDAGS